MEYKTYKVARGVYGGTEIEFITIPSDMVLLTGGSNDIGHFLHYKNFHYIGYAKAPYEELCEKCEGLAVSIQKFRKDDCFVLIHDIRFIDTPVNKIINPDEMKPSKYTNEIGKWNQEVGIGYKYEYCAFWSKDGKLIKMSQIQKITSEFNIQLNTVWNTSNVDDTRDLRIIEQETVDLDKLCLPGGYNRIKGIIVNGHIANAYHIKLLKNVLTPFGITVGMDKEVNSNDIDLDKLYNLFQDFIEKDELDCKKADALINMREI